VFLCISLVASVEYTITFYSDECITSVYTQPGTYDGTCSEWLAEQVAICVDAYDATECSNVELDSCFNNDYTEAQVGPGGYMYYECVELTDEPTYAPTEATCDDFILNGNETDVDCGGVDCDPCPEACSAFNCTFYGPEYTLIDAPESSSCAEYPCTVNDIDTCCIARSTCFYANCLSGDVVISASNTTYCASSECDTFDRDVCCATAGNCTNFDLCDATSQYLKDDPDLLKCNSEVCDDDDISKCCEDKATCDTYLCDFAGGLTAVDDDTEVYCDLNACTDDDEDVCCTARGNCTNFTCDDSQFVDKSDKADLFCSGSTCVDSDNYECCDEKQACVTTNPAFTYTCTNGNDLVDNPEDVFCNSLSCTDDDMDTCCPADPTSEPTLAPTPEPSPAPTLEPSPAPSPTPTTAPSPAPTLVPSPAPSLTPTTDPSPAPTDIPGKGSSLFDWWFVLVIVCAIVLVILIVFCVFKRHKITKATKGEIF